jgi:hypothetical protein
MQQVSQYFSRIDTPLIITSFGNGKLLSDMEEYLYPNLSGSFCEFKLLTSKLRGII